MVNVSKHTQQATENVLDGLEELAALVVCAANKSKNCWKLDNCRNTDGLSLTSKDAMIANLIENPCKQRLDVEAGRHAYRSLHSFAITPQILVIRTAHHLRTRSVSALHLNHLVETDCLLEKVNHCLHTRVVSQEQTDRQTEAVGKMNHSQPAILQHEHHAGAHTNRQ